MRWLFVLLIVLAPVSGARALLAPKLVTPETVTDSKAGEWKRPVLLGSWNLQWFPGKNPKNVTAGDEAGQVAGARSVLRLAHPDIFFTCEIRSLEALGRLAPEYPNRACTLIPRPPEENPELPNQGLALASRYAWKEIWALDFSALPDTPDRPHRGILGVEFAWNPGHRLTLYGVHLKSNRGSAESSRWRRERAVDYLFWDWQRRKLDPARDCIIIAGDFNTSVINPVFEKEQSLRRLLQSGFVDAAEGLPEAERVTVPARSGYVYPAVDFDHILVSAALKKELGGKVPGVRILPTSTSISDHRPLFFKLDMKRP